MDILGSVPASWNWHNARGMRGAGARSLRTVAEASEGWWLVTLVLAALLAANPFIYTN